MFKTIVFFPIIGIVFNIILNYFLNRFIAVFANIVCLVFSSLLSWISLYTLTFNHKIFNFKLFSWIASGDLSASWSILIDPLCSVMFVVITTVSALVHLYSYSYMHNDSNLDKFMNFLSLFTFSMLILVSADNFLQLFFGWEGVGICSYLLINFWYTRVQANKAAIKAILVNRIGDAGLVFGVLILFGLFKTVEFSTVFSLVPVFYSLNNEFINNWIEIACFFLFLGTVGKSAQLGLHTWLPDAMEGPTPVSALLHAATMVTAGIFLVIRCSSLFEFAPNVLFIMVIWGTLTAFFGSTTAFFQNDIKKIIAYSTCSQLGYMLAACGMSNYYSSLFHLFTHAFFKALLFLSAGIVIHGLANEQDIRKMGGLHRIFPFAFTMFIVGSLALGGFPFLSGFYSKDAIIETSLVLQEPTLSYFIPKLLYFTAVITSMYSTRLIYLVFLARPNSNLVAVKTTSEAEKPMLFSLSILAFGSIFAGYIFKDFFVGAGTDTFNVSIFVNFYSFDKNIFREFLPQTTKNITTLGCILIALVYLVYKNTGSGLNTIWFKVFFIKVYNFFNRKWYFDYIYNFWLVSPILVFGYENIFKVLDKGYLEKFGPFGLSSFFYKNSYKVNNLETGNVYHYVLWILTGLLFIFTIFELQFWL